MRTFSGKILLRVPAKIHKELAQEAFKSGRSINQICMAAILARKALKDYNPWKSIEKIWEKNKKGNAAQLTEDIRLALSEVRRAP